MSAEPRFHVQCERGGYYVSDRENPNRPVTRITSNRAEAHGWSVGETLTAMFDGTLQPQVEKKL